MTHQMICEGLAPAIPEGIHKDFVVLDGYRAHCGAQVKCPSLEHDTVLIVNARALWEDEQRCGVWRCYMRLHPFANNLSVFHLVMPDARTLLTEQKAKSCNFSKLATL